MTDHPTPPAGGRRKLDSPPLSTRTIECDLRQSEFKDD